MGTWANRYSLQASGSAAKMSLLLFSVCNSSCLHLCPVLHSSNFGSRLHSSDFGHLPCPATGHRRVWDCKPPHPAGASIATGTSCLFLCNGTTMGQVACDNPGHWDVNPEESKCTGGVTTPDPETTSGAATTPTSSTHVPTSPSTKTTTITTTEDLKTTVPETTSAATTTTTSTTTTTLTTTITTTITTTTVTPTTKTTVPTTTTTTTGFPNCPFQRHRSGKEDQTRSVFCPESYCPAVYISSMGGAAEHQPESLGCFDYEGSLMGNEFPDYINSQGWFLTPTAYSNPVMGYTEWVVSHSILDTGRQGNGTIRNIQHNDQ